MTSRRDLLKFLLTIATGIFLVSSFGTASPSNAIFDGVWVGTETTEPRAPLPPPRSAETVNQKRSAKIIIAENGTLLAVAEGICPGRYANFHRSGNSIAFEAGDCHLQLTLSADSKTLTEKGSSTDRFQIINGNVHYWKRIPVQVTGTFSRQK